MKVGGKFASRTRISECRTKLGMNIVNRQRMVDTPIGNYRVTEYAYMPEPSRTGTLERAEAQELPFA